MDSSKRGRRGTALDHGVSEVGRLISARIRAKAELLIDMWRNPEGTSTRHFIVDDVLPPHLVNAVYDAFPPDGDIWVAHHSFRESKKTFAKLDRVHPIIGAITDAFHTSEVLQAIESVTRIAGLEADPELYAGGISMMGRGDFLNPHIDNSHDAPRRRFRRLNLLYYVSPNWKRENGGNLELWDAKVLEARVIVSRCNRLVVMETNRTSWHSVSPVLVNRNRCCISNYYFSKSSPERSHYYHVTSFTGRPDQKATRLWGCVDNMARQCAAVCLGTSRGKSLSRFK